MDEHPIIIDGLKFKCKQCAECCKKWKGTIYISIYEVKLIAEKLNLTLEELFNKFIHFEEEKCVYCGQELNLTYLAVNQINNRCIFLDKNDKCIIHEFKPFLCKIFPFWSIIMENKTKFEEYSELCSGVNTPDGDYYTKDQIRKFLINEENYLQNLNRIALIMNSIDENEILALAIGDLDLDIDMDAIDCLKNSLIIEKIRILTNMNS
ncbi:MAG: YkgJ family cysteine cluster protein [Candidatus Helarchaeota archaeon]